MLCNVDINTLIGNKSEKKSLRYSTYDGVACRAPISNVGIENVGLAGQTGYTYQALV